MLNSYAFASSRIKTMSLDSSINKRKNLCIPYTARKSYIFIKKITKIQLFDLKYAILNRYAYESRNIEVINSEVTKNKSKFFQIPYVVWKIGILTKNTENVHFWLKYTYNNKYVVESPEIILSLRIEREKYVKASPHAKKHVSWPKNTFFTQISERSTCTHLHHSDWDSGGIRRWPIPASRLWPKKRKISLLNGYSSWYKHAINKFLIDNSASCSSQDIQVFEN